MALPYQGRGAPRPGLPAGFIFCALASTVCPAVPGPGDPWVAPTKVYGNVVVYEAAFWGQPTQSVASALI